MSDTESENEKDGGQNDPQKESKSLTHKMAGVTVTVSLKEEKRGDKNKGESESPQTEEAKGDGEKKNDQDKNKAPIYKKPAFIIVATIILILLIVGCIVFWLIARQYVSTDDAYIDANITQVSPRAKGQVLHLFVTDNQFVHRGDLLVELDSTDYEVALLQAQAQIAAAEGRVEQAQAQIGSAKAGVTQAVAEVNSAQVSLENATRDLNRYESVDERARSQQQLDNAVTAQKNAKTRVAQAKAKQASAEADVATTEASVKAAEGERKTAEASLKRAKVDLSYTKVFAPTDGRVTQRSVEIGNYVAVGQAMLMLVDTNVWVTANFKETQLERVRPGQHVTIKVDAFPDMELEGRVDSIQAGSGSRFSVLPAENATGNYVKIVQRVPVKIVFDRDSSSTTNADTNNAPMLSPGLSVVPKVKVR